MASPFQSNNAPTNEPKHEMGASAEDGKGCPGAGGRQLAEITDDNLCSGKKLYRNQQQVARSYLVTRMRLLRAAVNASRTRANNTRAEQAEEDEARQVPEAPTLDGDVCLGACEGFRSPPC